MQFRDLQKQYLELQSQIDAAVIEAISSGQYIGGAPVELLENELAQYIGVKHCITCANGTDALQLALMTWGVGKGDAVFVPDFTFFSSGEVVSTVGATPVFVDVCKDTFNLDPARLEEAIRFVEDNTDLTPRVVLAVDLFGLPADYPVIRSICANHNLLLLEDGAQGFGGSINGKMACSFGDISTTSFFPAKPLGCYGDGGAIFTDNDKWASLIRSYAVHGKGSMKYDNVRIGMNSRLDTVQAAILRVKLQEFVESELDAVNAAAKQYDELLVDFADKTGTILPFVPEGYISSWAQYTLKLSEGINRDELQGFLKDNDVPTMVYYPKPMHEQLAFKDACMVPDEGCLVTEELCKSVLSLPMGPYISNEEINYVSKRLEKNLSIW